MQFLQKQTGNERVNLAVVRGFFGGQGINSAASIGWPPSESNSGCHTLNTDMQNQTLREKHFALLKTKYHVNQTSEVSTSGFLYLILRKADLGLQVSDFEFKWLSENFLTETIDTIQVQKYQASELNRLNSELLQLKKKYKIPKHSKLEASNPTYSILWKLDTTVTLADLELKFLATQGFSETVALAQAIQDFSRLKSIFKASQHLDKFPESPLYSILKKLEAENLLSDDEADWLLNQNLEATLEIYWQQEENRKARLDFLQLKTKYQVSYPDDSIDSPLFPILKKLNLNKDLDNAEIKWLKKADLVELVEYDNELKRQKIFARLKERFKINQHQETKSSSVLYLILVKLEVNQPKHVSLFKEAQTLCQKPEFQILEQDIQWLSQEGLTETVGLAQQIHFKALKAKYQIVDPNLSMSPFYEIMLKLEREERLDPKQVIQLMEKEQLSRTGKIAIAHYRLEAIFYEAEYKRTGNRWNLPSASSNWRKAGKPEQALKATDNINWNKIREGDLRSALLVTRGATFRDLRNLEEAEKCATQAMECQPESHQPYTLMAALCYDRGEYLKGDKWFAMAAERGAEDTDDEIKRIVRMTHDKGKQKEVVEYLLGKDPIQYSWAKAYLAKN